MREVAAVLQFVAAKLASDNINISHQHATRRTTQHKAKQQQKKQRETRMRSSRNRQPQPCGLRCVWFVSFTGCIEPQVRDKVSDSGRASDGDSGRCLQLLWINCSNASSSKFSHNTNQQSHPHTRSLSLTHSPSLSPLKVYTVAKTYVTPPHTQSVQLFSCPAHTRSLSSMLSCLCARRSHVVRVRKVRFQLNFFTCLSFFSSFTVCFFFGARKTAANCPHVVLLLLQWRHRTSSSFIHDYLAYLAYLSAWPTWLRHRLQIQLQRQLQLQLCISLWRRRMRIRVARALFFLALICRIYPWLDICMYATYIRSWQLNL